MQAVVVFRVERVLNRPWRLMAMALACIPFIIPPSNTVTVEAGVVAAGNVEPELPWNSNTTAYVGKTADGSLTIDGGSTLSARESYLGYNPDVTGTAEVRDSGSMWNNVQSLFVAYQGSGALQIDAGGQVNNAAGYLGYGGAATGTAVLAGAGSLWSNSDMLAVGFNGIGTLRVEAEAVVSSASGHLGYNPGSTGAAVLSGPGARWTNTYQICVGRYGIGTLRVEAGAELSNSWGCVAYYAGATGTAVLSGTGSNWVNRNELYVGSSGHGTLRVEAGAQVSDTYGWLGAEVDSTGLAVITGADSKWHNRNELYVGGNGSGILLVGEGALVTNTYGWLGYRTGSTGTATVAGAGSKWINSRTLYVGGDGAGKLFITDGGQVSATIAWINNRSLLTIDVGRGSMLSVGGGTGPITNNGKVRILAGAEVPPGSQHTPILAGAWSGSGSYQAVGGTWDSVSRVFTASAVQSGSSGTPLALDLGQVQRALIDDPATGWAVGCSFLHKAGQVELTATAISGPVLSGLEALLPPGDVVLGGWEFTVGGSGYALGDPIHLSLAVGPGIPADALHLWHYDGSVWSSFTAEDLVYTGQYASFTVTGLSGYAVSAVPEPGVLLLVGSGLVFGLVFRPLGRGAGAPRPGRKQQR